MIKSVYKTQPRLTMETSSRKLQTKWLPRTPSNCQVSITPESQSRQRPEPYSGKQKAQYQDNLGMRQTGHRHPMPLIPKELAQDDEARNHATAAIIQDRCELSGVNDTIETVQPRNCVEQRKPKTQNQGQPGRRYTDQPGLYVTQPKGH